ncbi:MAG: pyridoxal-phosphate dependent enzyme [Acidobacteriia bacterium]|nr:pyridoxal-phosphate dependent enzyme [Terriglobia bacterium]
MDPRAYLCPRCGGDHEDPGIFDVHYDYAAARGQLARRADVFRYLPLLPVRGVGAVLNAGGTAMVEAPRLAKRLGLRALYLKDETRNPTRCLKDRATAIATTLALELGVRDVYCASAGNAAISLAGFAAHAGLRCHVFVPSYASPVRLDWLRRFGAEVHVSKGDYDQAFAEAEEQGKAHGWYSRNCAFNPFLVEGKKTCGLEIAEQVPADFVVAPVGDGCTLGGIGKGLREAREIGLTDRVPKLIGVQAAGVQPMVARFRGVQAEAGDTKAASIAVRRPRNALRLMRELRECGGEMIAVSDVQIGEAQRVLAEDAGIVAEFTSAATLAAVESMESLRGKTVVLVITGGRPD